MKKNFAYLAITLFMGLFASCSQENDPTTSDSRNKLVNISAELPKEFAQTRAVPSADGHYLRCILEITNENGDRVYREEKLGTEGNADGKLSFTFALEEAGTYNYKMWADFIEANGQEKDPVTGRYTDKFYNTEDLTKITIKDPALLYNTDACDAFSGNGTFEKSQATLENPLSVTLIRPFAKLIVSDKSKENFAKCTSVSISQEIPGGFDVSTGKISTETVEAVLPATAPIGTGEQEGEGFDLRLFSCYIFADNDALGEIGLTFVTTDGGRTVAIPANVPVKKNTRTLVRGYLVAESQNNGQIDTDFGDWNPDIDGGDVEPTEPTIDPKIGDYYYKNGEYSSELRTDAENPCIGVVFATKAINGDEASNYGEYTRIKGYVMALESAPSNTRKEFCDKAMNGTIDFTGMELVKTGYENTKAFLADSRYTDNSTSYPLLLDFIAFKEKTATPEKSSGWYIPSIEELKETMIKYHGFEETPANNVFVEAVNAIEGANQFVHTTSARYLLSSSISNKTITPVTLTDGVLDTNTRTQAIFNSDPERAGVQGQIRPILTILE
ncbi:hypothetical protein NXX54_10605 [Bacteroides sp. BFG-638]|uniref:DUF6562 domain-containing protein n=1 Tax=Bacteroides TaxID=816 RepID=UPI0021663EFF|nr:MULTISPECIES: DUF6562 domain-containing protein [unclassified Bacteroides]MCS2948797.1 hypothetical protein [Bacteroides sp. BFG-638]MCS3312392.1 hypothetical protein [Bacteroides sp. BFG-637]